MVSCENCLQVRMWNVVGCWLLDNVEECGILGIGLFARGLSKSADIPGADCQRVRSRSGWSDTKYWSGTK
jgi:hypothetical protein